MFADIGYTQRKKFNQRICGDYLISKRFKDSHRFIAVLSDGLGSGIKANILATMTATMLLKFIEHEAAMQRACEIVMNSLPICKVRKISYATFSAVDYNYEGEFKIVEEGNPQFIWIRDDGYVEESDFELITSKAFPHRQMHLYTIRPQLGDRFIFCSDGITQAALGTDHLKLGLRRSGLIKFTRDKIREEPNISGRRLSNLIVKMAQSLENHSKAQDDMTAMVVYFREPRSSLVFTGPPYEASLDNFYANMLQQFKGKKAICGGTTANLISRELNIPIFTGFGAIVGELPLPSKMENIDLVTEGILTLTKTCEYLERGEIKGNAAGELFQFLVNGSDCITFMVGAKINQAHYDPSLPIEIEIRKNIVKKIAKLLEDKYAKKVIIQYM